MKELRRMFGRMIYVVLWPFLVFFYLIATPFIIAFLYVLYNDINQLCLEHDPIEFACLFEKYFNPEEEYD